MGYITRAAHCCTKLSKESMTHSATEGEGSVDGSISSTSNCSNVCKCRNEEECTTLSHSLYIRYEQDSDLGEIPLLLTLAITTAASHGRVCCWLISAVTTVLRAPTLGRKSTISPGRMSAKYDTSTQLPWCKLRFQGEVQQV